VGYTPLDCEDFKGSRTAEDDDSTSLDEDFTFMNERTISPWGFT